MIGAPAAVKLARRLGFKSTIALAPSRRVVLDGRVAITGIRPAFPYGVGSIGLLIETLEDGVRTISRRTSRPSAIRCSNPRSTSSLPRSAGEARGRAVVDGRRRGGESRAETACALVAGDRYRASGGEGLLPQHLLKVDGDLETFEAVTGLHMGDGRGRRSRPEKYSKSLRDAVAPRCLTGCRVGRTAFGRTALDRASSRRSSYSLVNPAART